MLSFFDVTMSIFMIIPVGVVNNNNNKCVYCNKVSITGLKLDIVTGTTPVKIVFLRSVTGPIYKVKYKVKYKVIS
jgi:hypothetical protein